MSRVDSDRNGNYGFASFLRLLRRLVKSWNGLSISVKRMNLRLPNFLRKVISFQYAAIVALLYENHFGFVDGETFH